MPIRPRFAALSCSAILLLWGCEPETQWSELRVELLRTPGCDDMGAIESLELRALGDFPPRSEPFDLGAPRATFDGFPLETRELAALGQFPGDVRASGRTLLPAAISGESGTILIVPEGGSCPLSDEALIASEGVAAAGAADGGLLLAGGSSAAEILSSALFLPAGATLVEVVPDGMLQRRRYASATRVDERIVVAGGASSARGAAETYEVFDSARGSFPRELSRKLTAGPRMQHAAARLPDGSVLLVGGRAEPDGEPLGTAELIRLDQPPPNDDATPAPLLLASARAEPQLIVLDSGRVIVAGGRSADGALVPTLERFEPAAMRFIPLELTLTAFEHWAAVGLPGGRIAWVGCDTSMRVACALELVLLRGEEPLRVDVALDWSGVLPLGLRDLRALALDDGRVLITGREPDANMQRRAVVIDIAQRELSRPAATRAPSVLLSLADSAIIELDGVGASLRRLGGLSVYESPEGNLVASDPLLLALDAPDRWQRSGDGLRALLAGARLDLPRLQLGAFRLELELEGRALLRLRAAGLPELALQIGAGARPAADCPQLPAAGTLVVERHEQSFALWSDLAPDSRCELAAPSDAPLALALEAEAETLLRSFRINRL